MHKSALFFLLAFASASEAASLSSGLRITLTIQPGLSPACPSSGPKGSAPPANCPPYTKRQAMVKSSSLSPQEDAWLRLAPGIPALNSAQVKTLALDGQRLRTVLEF